MTVKHYKTYDVMFNWVDIVSNVIYTHKDSLIDHKNKVNQLISYESIYILSN